MQGSGQQGTMVVRLIPALLLTLLVSVPAAAKPAQSHENWRFRDVSFVDSPAFQLPGADIGPLGRIGVGMFGNRDKTARQRAVTVREIDAPRQRRPGVGLSVKF